LDTALAGIFTGVAIGGARHVVPCGRAIDYRLREKPRARFEMCAFISGRQQAVETHFLQKTLHAYLGFIFTRLTDFKATLAEEPGGQP